MKIFRSDRFISNNLISASLKRIKGDMQYHGHNFSEIEFVLDGDGTYEIDGVSYSIRKNTVFIMNPYNIHAIKNADATIVNVMFLQDSNGNQFDYYFDLKSTPTITLDDEGGALLTSMFLEIAKNSDTEPDYAMNLLNCILFKLNQSRDNTNDQGQSYVSKAISYIYSHFNQGLTLTDVSSHLGLSAPYFSNLFHKESGISFKEYLDDIRFSYAKKLLRYSNLSVKEVQYRSGFTDYSNFSRRFKSRFQLTPIEYRFSKRCIQD